MQKALLFLLGILFLGALAPGLQAQGVTTAFLTGFVLDEEGNGLEGATVIAVHEPSGSRYGVITRSGGKYDLPNVRVGGPYTITAKYLGYQETKIDGVYLSLGESGRYDFNMAPEGLQTDEVVITATTGTSSEERTGAETRVTKQEIESLPTINRALEDYVRVTPQVSTAGSGISIAGTNNRFNSIYIDGAVNNDVFGLAASGTNGGQTGVQPISVDALEQIQVVVAPYDVKFGGFAGGGINAVTRSGTNNLEASAYWYHRDANLVGRRWGDRPSVLNNKVADFNANLFGARIGGALIKDKLFFFVNAEFQRDNTPQPFTFENNYLGNSTRADIEAFEQRLAALGWESGGFENNTEELRSDKFLARVDYAVNDNHKITLRHSYVRAENISPRASRNNAINFNNNGVFFPSTTNSSALEWSALFDGGISNQLIIGYTNVNDDRDPIGNDFPTVQIRDGAGRMFAGSEPFSTANQLRQNIVTLTNNLSIYRGRHTITIGTHNEFFDIYNLFLRKNYGEYVYSSLNDFLNDSIPLQYERGYSLVDDVTGDGSEAAAAFNAMQLAVYAQDEFSVSSKFTLTFGIRLDVPLFLSQPTEDVSFNTNTIPLIEAAGYDLQGARAGQMPSAQLMFGPRVGFNYDLTGEKQTILRGGAGIFTSRVPFVWPGGAYTNNGLTVGGVFVRSADIAATNPTFAFRPDPFNQYTNQDFGRQDAIPSGQMDLFVEDFKYPQVLRASLAIDQKLPWGMIGTIEGIYTKTLNNVLYYNYNVDPTTTTRPGPDDRPIYSGNDIDPTYTRIIVADNTNEGYTYSITAQLQRPIQNDGFGFSLAYTYGQAKALNDGTSSQNSSQWRFTENVRGNNDLDLSFSDFDLGHRINGYVSYSIPWLGFMNTTISLFYNGQSGRRFSYIYGENEQFKRDDSGESALIYVPANQNEIIFVGSTAEQDQQWADFQAYVSTDEYLQSRQGDYAERNGSRLPFEHQLDLRVLHDFFLRTGSKEHRLQLSMDILNFTSLLNPRWGRRYFVSNNNFTLLEYEGEDVNGAPTFRFNAPTRPSEYNEDGTVAQEVIDRRAIFSVDQFLSRWRMQLGIRYIFN